MVFYTVIMGITKFSAFPTHLRRTGGPLRGTMCLLEGS